MIAGTEHINVLWRKCVPEAGLSMQVLALKRLLGIPDNGIKSYSEDESGFHTRPRAGSTVVPHNRVDFLTHTNFVRSLGGERLTRLHNRWQARFKDSLAAAVPGADWMEMPDFVPFWQNTFGLALIEAVVGPILRCVNADLVSYLSLYDSHIPELGRGMPRWMNRRAFALRDKLLAAVMQWHAIARAQFKESLIDADGDADPCWGSAFI